MKNKIAIIKIKLEIAINPISSILSWFLSDEHIFDNSDVFRTLKLPNVSFEYTKLVYIYFNIVHPWNAFWLIFGSSVPKK